MANDVVADLQDQFVFRIELVELGTSGGLALKDPEIALGIQGNRRDSTGARWQNVRIGERITQRLLPLDAL
jgi:hypothetical protein